MDKVDEDGQRYKLPVRKLISPRHVMYSTVTMVNKYYTGYLKVAKRVDHKSSHKKKIVAVWFDGC